MARKNSKTIRRCEICGQEFIPTRPEYTVCSWKCGGERRRRKNRVSIKCDYCKRVFSRTPNKIKHSKNHYCSQICYAFHQRETQVGESNHNYKKALKVFECATCGKEIITYRKNARYCSYKCMKTINLKAKGNRFEWDVLNYFKGLGYLGVRSAGSHGMADVIVITSKNVYLLQLKVSSRENISTMFDREIESMRNVVVPNNCFKEFWYKRNKDKIYRIRMGKSKDEDIIEQLPLTLPFEFNVFNEQ